MLNSQLKSCVLIADGELYVHGYELDKANELPEKLDIEVPDLPP